MEMKCSDPGCRMSPTSKPLKRSGHTSLNDLSRGRGVGPFLPRRRENHVWESEVRSPVPVGFRAVASRWGGSTSHSLVLLSAGAASNTDSCTSSPLQYPSGGVAIPASGRGKLRHCEIQ